MSSVTRHDTLRVAWISDFPIEWLADVPEEISTWPRQHAASWQRVLLAELEQRPDLDLHVICLRRRAKRELIFKRRRVTFHIAEAKPLRARTLFWRDTLVIRRLLSRIEPDLVHAWGTEQGAAQVARRCPYPFLISMQGILSWYVRVAPMPASAKIAAFVERYTLRKPAHVTVESAFGRRYLQEHFPRLKLRQIEHAPAWMFHHVQRKPQTNPPQILFVGTVNRLKGADLLFYAAERASREFGFRLSLIGDVPNDFAPELSAIMRSPLGLRIAHASRLEPEEVAAAMSRTTLLFLPSRADNSPNIVKEAVVAGVPVIASDVGGIPDHVAPGQNGLLFPAGDREGAARALREALRHPLFGRGLVDSYLLSRKRAVLSPSVMAEQFVLAYNEVLDGFQVACRVAR